MSHQQHVFSLVFMILLNGFLFPLGLSKPHHSPSPDLVDRHVINPFTHEEYAAIQKNLNAQPLSENRFTKSTLDSTTERTQIQSVIGRNTRTNRNSGRLESLENYSDFIDEDPWRPGEVPTRDTSKWYIFQS